MKRGIGLKHIEKIAQADYFSSFKNRGQNRHNYIEQYFSPEVASYISEYADLSDPDTELVATAESFNIQVLNGRTFNALVNLKRINDLSKPNDFFSLVNQKLAGGGFFICCGETAGARRRRILKKHHRLIAYPYYFADFLLKRVFPKLVLTRKINSILTRGINRVMSMTEMMGRLAACGFEVSDYREIGGMTYFVCRKIKAPVYNGVENTGLIIKLSRVGKNGEFIDVYKFRTMHPYAEYLQDYVNKQHSLDEGGKFKKDFRITSWGCLLRKFWIDEQPMWINWLKREMKLVGVRPLSKHYFNLYPEELRERRVKYKPGLIPPFYVDLPTTFEQIVESEKKYLDAYEKSPLLTDIRYFWQSFYNIFIKRARSA